MTSIEAWAPALDLELTVFGDRVEGHAAGSFSHVCISLSNIFLSERQIPGAPASLRRSLHSGSPGGLAH